MSILLLSRAATRRRRIGKRRLDAGSEACLDWCQPGFGVGFNNGVMEDPGVVSPGGTTTAGGVARARGVAVRDPVPDVFAPRDGEIEPPAGCLLTHDRQAVSVLNFRAL